MHTTVRRHDLALRHPFGISRGTTSVIPTFSVELDGGGTGEGSPVRYRNEKADEGAALVERIVAALEPSELEDFPRLHARLDAMAREHASARACVDIAAHDRLGRTLGAPLHRVFGYAVATAASSFTIAIDSDEKMIAKVAEAAAFPILKIKLGRDDIETDARTLRAIRAAAPDKVLRVDANGGWSIATAIAMSGVAADLEVEYIEQPLAIGNIEELARLRDESPLPIYVDEDARTPADLPRLIGRVDGINIKLMKCGGLWPARQMIAFARTMGWKVMLGCMIESSIAIAAAAHLAGAVDTFDLDAELLITNNPAGPGVLQPNGTLATPSAPGLGVSLHH